MTSPLPSLEKLPKVYKWRMLDGRMSSPTSLFYTSVNWGPEMRRALSHITELENSKTRTGTNTSSLPQVVFLRKEPLVTCWANQDPASSTSSPKWQPTFCSAVEQSLVFHFTATAGSRAPTRYQGKIKVSTVRGKWLSPCDFRFHSPQLEPELPLLKFKAKPSESKQKFGVRRPITGFPAARDRRPPQTTPSQRASLTVQPWITTKVLLLWLKWQLDKDSRTPGMRWQVSSTVSSGVRRANLLSMSAKSLSPVISEKEKKWIES